MTLYITQISLSVSVAYCLKIMLVKVRKFQTRLNKNKFSKETLTDRQWPANLTLNPKKNTAYR